MSPASDTHLTAKWSGCSVEQLLVFHETMFVQGGIPLVEPHSEWFWVVSTCFVIFPFVGKLTYYECWPYPDGHAQMHFFNGHLGAEHPASGLSHFRSCFLPFCSLGIKVTIALTPRYMRIFPSTNQSLCPNTKNPTSGLEPHIPHQICWCWGPISRFQTPQFPML